jgi:CheY-like chemotaxis protein
MNKGEKTILVVEDEQSMITLIRYNLESEGYNIYAVRNGKEALKQCKSCLPQLIISDIGMPEMDGFEFRQALLDDKELRDIPFIFLTARSQSEDQFKGMRLGVSHFLTKPFEPELLLMTVAEILGK